MRDDDAAPERLLDRSDVKPALLDEIRAVRVRLRGARIELVRETIRRMRRGRYAAACRRRSA